MAFQKSFETVLQLAIDMTEIGGRLWAESVGAGQGATFRGMLPYASQPEETEV